MRPERRECVIPTPQPKYSPGCLFSTWSDPLRLIYIKHLSLISFGIRVFVLILLGIIIYETTGMPRMLHTTSQPKYFSSFLSSTCVRPPPDIFYWAYVFGMFWHWYLLGLVILALVCFRIAMFWHWYLAQLISFDVGMFWN